jgi:hypothetical protein
MRLREYRTGAAPAARTDRGIGIQAKSAGAAAIAVILVGTGAWLALKGRAAAVPTDAATLCPTQRPPAEIDVILLDVSSRFSEPQRLQIQNQLSRFRDSIPRFGLVEVYTVDRLRRRVTEPILHLCNPGTGADLNRIYQNPELARKKWNGFATKLQADIDSQVSRPPSKTSPIFEAIQATALRTFGNPAYDGLPQRLLIISDLLQNVPGGLSMYQGVPSFESFEKTPYYSRVRSNLDGVSVVLYYLARSGEPKQGPKHLEFWEDYFKSQGARVKAVNRVFGDQ